MARRRARNEEWDTVKPQMRADKGDAKSGDLIARQLESKDYRLQALSLVSGRFFLTFLDFSPPPLLSLDTLRRRLRH